VSLLIRTRAQKLVRSDAGTSMVEFAIIAPVFVFLLIGLIEVGRFAYFGILAANAARAGAQYGAQTLSTAADVTGMQNAAVADGQQNVSAWTVTPTNLCSQSGGNPAPCPSPGATPPTNTIYYVQVQVSATFHPLLNYPGIPHSVPINGSATMRVANQ
jgi:Flp pilus assembly protein TadG